MTVQRFEFMNKKNFMVHEHGCSCINLWRLIAVLIAKQAVNLFKRDIRFGRDHFCRDFS